jgi:hypothetical protein
MATEEQRAVSESAGATAQELREIHQALERVAQGQARLLRLMDGSEDDPGRGLLWRVKALEDARRDTASAHQRIEEEVRKLRDALNAQEKDDRDRDEREQAHSRTVRLEMSKAWIAWFAAVAVAVLTALIALAQGPGPKP